MVGDASRRPPARAASRWARTWLDAHFVVDAKWDSSFIGAIALPAAINQYTALYRTLAGKLFADPDFQEALTT